MEVNAEKSKNRMRAGLKAIWRHIRPFQKQLTIMVVLGVISSIANGFVPYVTGHFFEALIGLSQNKPVVASSWPLWGIFLGAWVVVELVANNIDWTMDRLRRKVSTAVQFKIQADGFSHMFRLPLTHHKNAHTNGELQKISQASWRVSAILDTAGNIAPQFLGIFIGIILAATISILMASVLLLGVLIYSTVIDQDIASDRYYRRRGSQVVE